MSVVDVASETVVGLPIMVGVGPASGAFSPDESKLYVSNNGGVGTVNIIDTSTNTVIGAPIMVGAGPFVPAVSADGLKVFVPDNGGGAGTTVSIITNDVTVSTVTVGAGPRFVTLTPLALSVITGECITDRFLSQSELVNVVRWSVPTFISTPVKTLIYRDETLTILAGEVQGNIKRFNDHNRKKGEVNTYFIVSVGQNGVESLLGNVSVTCE